MDKLRRILVALLALSLLLAAGCVPGSSNPANSTGAQPTTASTQKPADASEPQEEDGPLTKYKETITVTTISHTSPNIKYAEGESVDDNIQTRLNLEHLNIKWVNKFIVDDSKLDEKVNLAISSNDLPDVFSVNLQQLQNVIKADQVQDIGTVYEKYASENLKNNMVYGGDFLFKPAKSAGKTYGIPMPYDYYDNIALMHIRMDWLEKLNLKVPETLEELEAVAKAFAEQDPDGNGVKDTYGFVMRDMFLEGDILTFDAISNSMNAYAKIWLKNSAGDGIVYGSIQPEMKNALAKFQEYYELGLIDPEFAVMDRNKSVEPLMAGKIGIEFGPFWHPHWPLLQSLDTDKNAKWEAFPVIKGINGTPAPKAFPNCNRWIVIRKDFENPEACIKSMNLWFELMFGSGPQNEEFLKLNYGKYQGMNVHTYAKPFFFDKPDSNVSVGVEIREAIKKNDASLAKSARAKTVWDEIQAGTPQGWALNMQYTKDELFLMEYDNLVKTEFFSAPTPTMVTSQATLDKLELETFTKIIMGADISEFDAFVEQWKKLGGEQITKEVNDWWAASR